MKVVNGNRVELRAPLGVDWTPQPVRLALAGVRPGAALAMSVDGAPAPFQFTGETLRDGSAEIIVRLGFKKGETHAIEFAPAESSSTDLARRDIPLPSDGGTIAIGTPGSEALVARGAPFSGFAGRRMDCEITVPAPIAEAALGRTCDGPLFTDYEYAERRTDGGRYTVRFRCHKAEPLVEVEEDFRLGMGASLRWTLNPDRRFTHIVSRDSFEGESQPTAEPLGEEHPRDVLCRLQMPVLTEYFIPNNRGWFAFFDERRREDGMVGVLGLHGAKWEAPVEGMPEILDAGGTVEWRASLASGRRFWLLYAGPVETRFSEPGEWCDGRDQRFVFHRLHAEFNALRLDEHLDLDGTQEGIPCPILSAPVFFPSGDFHAEARRRATALACLGRIGGDASPSFSYLLDPTPAKAAQLRGALLARIAKWVRQFQGYREGRSDYAKNVIGFSRALRALILDAEMLARDGELAGGDACAVRDGFIFAARRILDEGRWPHSRSWKHPDHPDSTRDFYAYVGEHKPDRLVWTNCLPNFQSDPMCALAQLAAAMRGLADARAWLRFALDDIDRQLDAYCGPDGAWEESINYALYTFRYFVITFRAIKAAFGIDYFRDERMRRFAGWLCHFFGPYDRRFGAYTWPAIGNSVLPQNQAEALLCFAGELDRDDPLRADCIAVWQRVADAVAPSELAPLLLAAASPEVPREPLPLPGRGSATMAEVGVAMRDAAGTPRESYLFQKIGFAKDHYEDDEGAFNWYAKGAPFCMDYGTYTGDAGTAASHNAVEIAEQDALRRGYLAKCVLGGAFDYTRAEIPVTLKLLWGRIRSFDEIDNGPRGPTPYFYIGDKNPVGPKCWKTRVMLFAKPDYIAVFDRVHGSAPHRYNLHFTGGPIVRDGATLSSVGRFDLDLLAFVQHPAEFRMEAGELVPHVHPGCGGEAARALHAQHFARVYNETDGVYRTLVFAKERGRGVEVSAFGETGMKVVTPEYVDYVFIVDEFVEESVEGVEFAGRAGWIRRYADGRIEHGLPEGEAISAFGKTFVSPRFGRAGSPEWHPKSGKNT